MAIETTCQTPGAEFATHIRTDGVTVGVALPFDLDLDEEGAALLEANLHNALELVLAPYFTSRR